MSKKKNKNKDLDLSNHSAADESDLVTFNPGSSIIDIGELRRAQQQVDDFLDEEEVMTDEESEEIDADRELSLDEQAALIRKELDSDETLKTDVLAGFNEEGSDENMDRIASVIGKQTDEQVIEYEALASDVSDELKAMNDLFIIEDKLLESSMAQEAEEDLLAKALNDREEAKRQLATAFGEDEDGEIADEEMSEEDTALKAALPQADEEGNYDMTDLQSCIEALLFYSDRPVSLKKLKDMLEMSESDDAPIIEALTNLKEVYAANTHGFEVAEIAGGYQLRTKPSKAPLLRKLAKVQVQRLSRGAMETLTIVSYKQPCTKDDIDQVRGVDSSHFIRTLLDRKLIEVSGRSEAAGRPMIYATTDTFLEVFGLMDLKGLPPLREIEAMVPQMAAAEAGGEDPRVVQMRKMVNQMKTESNHLDYSAKEDEEILQEIRDRVKSIDISSPYMERQKTLAAEGIVGDEADAVLAREFGFDRATSGGETIDHSIDHNVEGMATEGEEHAAEAMMTSKDQTELNLDSDIPTADQIDALLGDYQSDEELDSEV